MHVCVLMQNLLLLHTSQRGIIKGESIKQIILITEMLTDIRKGIYTQTIYYSNGEIEVRYIPKGPVIEFNSIVKNLY